ncbi:MAG: hypothetical protein RIB60_09485 [Phycisphaerales bacterium]
MRIGPVVFWVVLAAALGALVIVTRGPANPDDGRAGGVVTLGIDIAQVRSIRTEGDAGVSIERAGSGGWLVRWTDSGRPVVWPADDELARAGLRVLAAAEFAPRTGDERPDLAGSVLVRSEGGELRLRWGGSPIAGRIAAEIDAGDGPRAVWMEERLARALDRASLMRWRSSSILRLASRPVGLEIEMPDRSVRLSASDGVWRLDGARTLAVDQALVDETLGDLGRMVAESFEEHAAEGPLAASVRVAGIDGSERRLELIGAINAAGTRFAARVSGLRGGVELGPVGVVINAEPLGRLSPDARAYLRGTAIDGSRIDVASVELVSAAGGVLARATRSIDGWRSDADPGRFGAFVELLTDTKASAIGDGSASEPVGFVRVRDAALEAPIEIELARRADGALELVVRSEALAVSFEYADAEAQRVLAWAAGLLG